MSAISVLMSLINGYKTHAAVILAVAAGFAAILTGHYDAALADLFRALALVFAGASAIGLRHAIHQVPGGVIDAARNCD